jgi:hypothetical protein
MDRCEFATPSASADLHARKVTGYSVSILDGVVVIQKRGDRDIGRGPKPSRHLHLFETLYKARFPPILCCFYTGRQRWELAVR